MNKLLEELFAVDYAVEYFKNVAGADPDALKILIAMRDRLRKAILRIREVNETYGRD